MEHVAGIIPTRAGSKGLPDKCMQVISGRTLIHHAVQQALRTVRSAFVITDSLAHADEAQRAGAVPIIVDHEVPDDALPEHQERRAMEMFPELFAPFTGVCRLFVTHPLRSDRDILRGLIRYRETGRTVVSVTQALFQEHQLLEHAGNRWWPYSEDPRRPRQQVRPPVTYLVGCFYLASLEGFKAEAFWPSEGFEAVEVPAIRTLDVDTQGDLDRARVLFKVKSHLDGLE